MLDRTHRFHGLGSLNYVYKQGSTARSQSCNLKYTLNNRRQTYRLAVVVSKKVHKSAVVRNRIRRRVYEAFRLQAATIDQPYDLVISVYSDIVATLPAVDLRRELSGLLRKSAVITSVSD